MTRFQSESTSTRIRRHAFIEAGITFLAFWVFCVGTMLALSFCF